ncbi:GTP-binding protein [Acorus calamus]|uniref:GTP-binding protein n=1 Tax=Acorus calamus TaxID=4465 RepID=A0AAV9CVQ6_ACOCL|nr:GTP-binding protein [Acorus calamus]
MLLRNRILGSRLWIPPVFAKTTFNTSLAMKSSPRRTLCASTSATVPLFVPPGWGGGGAGDGAARVEYRGGSLRGSRADKGGGVREEQRETERLPEGRSARIRRRGSIERREVEPHQRPREEEGGRHDFQETRFAKAPDAARNDWTSFTKGYFLNRETLVAVLLLIDSSIPPQQIDLDCANWLGRNNIPITFVFTKCDKMKGSRGSQLNENLEIQELISKNYKETPPWIMTSGVTGLGRKELLLHMSQLRHYWDN